MTSDFSSLYGTSAELAYWMFDNCSVKNFNASLSGLSEINNLGFDYNSPLENFKSDLSSLTQMPDFFMYNQHIKKFEADLGKLTNLDEMFQSSSIESFKTSATGYLYSANRMF